LFSKGLLAFLQFYATMSQRTERWMDVDRDALLERALELYHIPVLVFFIGFMLWNRVKTWKNFVTDERVFFSGNDAWYHLRQTTYTVHHWPTTMPFDPWTHFPYGNAAGQFGTFYDQLVATAALIIGLGTPDQRTIALTLLFAPAVIGALTAIPIYFIGRRLGGRPGGLVSVLILALTSGGFLGRSLVGFSDHHAAEALFQAIAFLGVMVALYVAVEEKPVYELVVEREIDALKRPLGFAALAGIAIALYIWVWPPGIVIAAILTAFFIIQLSLEYLRGESPEHTAIVGVGMLVVAGIFVALRISTFTFTATDLSLLQPAMLFAVALGLVVMAAIARLFDAKNIDRRLYPVVVFGGIALTIGTMSVVVPELYSYMTSQALRFIGLSTTAAQRTVSEAQPLSLKPGTPNYWITVMNYSYGLAFYSAAVGVLVALGRLALADDTRPGQLLIVIWGVFMTLAVFTQVRFNYYFALPVAALNGYLIGVIAEFLNLDAVNDIADIEMHQVLTLFTVFLLLTGPFVMLGSAGAGGIGLLTTKQSAQNGPSAVTQWDSSLEWLSNNTPKEGQYGRPASDNKSMKYYGAYKPTENFNYTRGSYGVMSWWDYGHWITVLGHRIPDANPFQQGATKSANFLLATNESHATDLIDGNESTRYVMIDWQLGSSAGGKYPVPTKFESNYSISKQDLNLQLYVQQKGRYRAIGIPSQRHYESLRVRLYVFHGSAISPKPIVIDWKSRQVQTKSGGMTTIRVIPRNGSAVKQFENMSAARAYVEKDGSSRIGLVGNSPSKPVPALNHYRLVHASPERAPKDVPAQSWVKSFERVPGATVTGTGPPNTTVTASVTMRIPTTNKTFVYRQHAKTNAQGEFTMTLPYSTTGYGKWGTKKGYTNVSVRATGQYTFTANTSDATWTATSHVTEAQVIGEDQSSVQVTLDRSATNTTDSQNGTKTENGTNTSRNMTNASTSPNETNANGTVSNQRSIGGLSVPLDSAGETATTDLMIKQRERAKTKVA
jgi:oligosaccharyl transferase (archaeosortase A-associated)